MPTDDNCEEEGKVVCNGGRIKGQPGVAMDDLVYVCTKIARQMDAAGIDKVTAGAAAADPLVDSWGTQRACSSDTAPRAGRADPTQVDQRKQGATVAQTVNGAIWLQVLEAIDVVTQVVEDARPLLLRAIELADQV